ncbi:MAG: outer membrane beta-barrel protein [Bacteroidia bacterium]
MVFNLENSIISTGKNGLEVLNDLPGVTATDDGIISVMGKSGVLIMVNDKPVHMDVTALLKSLDASQIEKIEVITNPSAKYEAAGKAVINIVLKKDKNMGLNGQIYTEWRQGISASFADGLNMDYRTKKWNFFGDFNENIFHYHYSSLITSNFSADNIMQQILTENIYTSYQGTLPFGNIGVDFTPDKNQTISFSSQLAGQFENAYVYDNTGIYNSKSILDSSVYEPSLEQLSLWDLNFNLNYTYKIDSTGKEFSANGFYVTHQSNDNQNLPVNYFNSYGASLRSPSLSTNIQLNNMYSWIGQADYAQPIDKKAKLEMGVFASNFHSDNNAHFYEVVNGEDILDTTRTNHFIFTENIFAGYLNYSQKLSEVIDFQLGLRAEQTMDNGVQYVHDTSFTRNYLNLFPSATLNWKPTPDNVFSLSYTCRIDRPDPGDLNPFITVTEPYSYTQGNITLLPTLSDNYQLNYNYKQYLSITLAHIYMTNVESQVLHMNDSTHITTAMLENLNSYSEYNIMFIGNIPLKKWWNTVTSINLFNDNFYGAMDGYSYNRNQYAFLFKTLNTFTMKKGWRAEISFWYNSTMIDGLNTIQPMYDLEAGIGKRFDKERLEIQLSYTDILKTETTITSQVYENVNVVNSTYGDNRKFKVVVSWKFGKSEYERERNNNVKTLGGFKAGN